MMRQLGLPRCGKCIPWVLGFRPDTASMSTLPKPSWTPLSFASNIFSYTLPPSDSSSCFPDELLDTRLTAQRRRRHDHAAHKEQ